MRNRLLPLVCLCILIASCGIRNSKVVIDPYYRNTSISEAENQEVTTHQQASNSLECNLNFIGNECPRGDKINQLTFNAEKFNPARILKDINAEELTVYITESNKLRSNIKADITFLKSKAKELIGAVVKAEKPRAPTITVIQKVKSKGFVKVESRNTGHKVAMYLALAALCSIIFGVVYAIYFADEWDFTPFIFIAMGLLLLALALFAYLIQGGRLRFRLGFLGL